MAKQKVRPTALQRFFSQRGPDYITSKAEKLSGQQETGKNSLLEICTDKKMAAQQSIVLPKKMWPKKSVSRVLFPAEVARCGTMIIPLGPLLPTASSSQTLELRADRPQTFLYSALLRMGFTELPTSPPELVSSYLTLSPLPAGVEHQQAVSSLWHFP